MANSPYYGTIVVTNSVGGSAVIAAMLAMDVRRQDCQIGLQTQCIFTTIPQGGFAQVQRKKRKINRSIIVLIRKILRIQRPFRDNPAVVAVRKMAAAMVANLTW